jgi:hypothetical protein
MVDDLTRGRLCRMRQVLIQCRIISLIVRPRLKRPFDFLGWSTNVHLRFSRQGISTSEVFIEVVLKLNLIRGDARAGSIIA